MPKCGSQCIFCDLPVRYDTYEGCSHACKYCFANRKKDISDIRLGESIVSLKKFVDGYRNRDLKAFDWKIPLHIGGMSDPLQPCELKWHRTEEALKVLADSNYPYVLSTKGKLVADKKFLNLFEEGNAVIQISMASSRYDKIEQGAPTFEERLRMLESVSGHCKRSIVRVQPYFHGAFPDIIKNMRRYKDAGAYGVILEGMKFIKRQKGTIKLGADFVYPKEILEKDFKYLRDEAHANGLAFFAGENRLRAMGDSLTCCGVEGLEGFEPNRYNLAHIMNGDNQEPRKSMKVVGTATVFTGITQRTEMSRAYRQSSFEQGLAYFYKEKREYVDSILGK